MVVQNTALTHHSAGKVILLDENVGWMVAKEKLCLEHKIETSMNFMVSKIHGLIY